MHQSYDHIRRGIDIVVEDKNGVMYCGLQACIQASAAPPAPVMSHDPGTIYGQHDRLFGGVVYDNNIRFIVFECMDAFDDASVAITCGNNDRKVHRPSYRP